MTTWAALTKGPLFDQCSALTDEFRPMAEECMAKSVGGNAEDTESACACWEGVDSFTKFSGLKTTCKFSEEAAAVANALKGCVAKFGECRKYEDDAVTALSNCMTETEIGKHKLLSLVSKF